MMTDLNTLINKSGAQVSTIKKRESLQLTDLHSTPSVTNFVKSYE
jgi:hypothetical protein